MKVKAFGYFENMWAVTFTSHTLSLNKYRPDCETCSYKLTLVVLYEA